MNTVKEVVEQLNIIEQEQTNYTEKAEIVSKGTDENESNTDKDQNESNDSGLNKSGAADDKIHMKVESIEITEAKNNINIKEIETNEHTLTLKLPGGGQMALPLGLLAMVHI